MTADGVIPRNEESRRGSRQCADDEIPRQRARNDTVYGSRYWARCHDCPDTTRCLKSNCSKRKSSLLAICCAGCTYISRGSEREEGHDDPVLEGDAIRDRQRGRTAALGSDDRDGVPARAGHVRRHGRRPDLDGVRPESGYPLLRHRHADLLRRCRRRGTQLPRLELRLHRAGGGGHRHGSGERRGKRDWPGPRRYRRRRCRLHPDRADRPSDRRGLDR